MAYSYITELNENVTRTHVRFNNRYGIAIAGDLYQPKQLEANKQYEALIVGAPYGGTKEQGPSVYANEMAQRGYVVLTFDQVFMGESGGEPRNIASPELFTESFSACVDFLGTKVPYVDREKIGVIGICGSGGFSLSAAAQDTRIKAVATASMYDISVMVRMGQTPEEIAQNKQMRSLKRWEDATNGTPEYIPGFPEVALDAAPAGLPEPYGEFFRFYGTKRGHHPSARGGFTTTSDLAMMNYSLLAHIDEVSPRPILMIVGDKAHSNFFSEAVYATAKGPKEMYVVDDCEHIDLYDRMDRIPFDKLEKFFADSLK